MNRPQTINIEGKYIAIKKHIKSLVKQGWEVVTITGEPDFKMTRVELINDNNG